jgi:hypothetical protein
LFLSCFLSFAVFLCFFPFSFFLSFVHSFYLCFVL